METTYDVSIFISSVGWLMKTTYSSYENQLTLFYQSFVKEIAYISTYMIHVYVLSVLLSLYK